ncbi:muconolactone Delta-isomerase family protein [Streptomyces sp. A012304]|uniref:muconolactone Delta-isomerase family protein n=1 Tax=Streptomyces sp. A012304 TaxID=375446 RepID=UPI0035D43C50
MEFLVRTENRLPAHTLDSARDQLRRGERERAMERPRGGRAQGTLAGSGPQRHGRPVRGRGPAALHDAQTSLPMRKWTSVTAEALATHPQE